MDGGPVILLLDVDELFLMGDKKLITESKRNFATEVKMMHYFLDIEVWEKSDDIFMFQGKYVVEIMKKFKMMD
jgi:hypothetical protein